MNYSWIFCAALVGCSAAPSLPSVRFANEPIVRVVNDRRNVEQAPESRLFLPNLYLYDGSFQRAVTRALELPRARRALGVNAIDEVPDSTWFTNRIGAHDLSPAEISNGNVTDNPELHKPWVVRSTKVGGTSVGFIIKDSVGHKYMLKFDESPDPPEIQTGTHVAVNRLLWASGYNVAEDQIVYLRAEDLVLAPDAKVKDLTNRNVRALDRAELMRDFARIDQDHNGEIRALASRWIDGTTIGGHPAEGVRSDDPNDLIPHELRRDLRGQFAIYAWLDAVDVTEGQYVDSWVTDRADPKRHYVEHYAIDFGKSFGAMGALLFDWWRSHTYEIDFVAMLRAFVTLGFEHRPWEHRVAPPLPGVASLFEAKTFDPGTWHPDTPGYIPFRTADRIDKFWATKIIARFTRPQIRAAITAGRFSDPDAIDYITDTLIARQHKSEEYWFSRVTPLDQFSIATALERDQLCFDDLALRYNLPGSEQTQYSTTSYDFAGKQVDSQRGTPASTDGHTCIAPTVVADHKLHDGYTIVKIVVSRPRYAGAIFVHVARDPNSSELRVIGVWRP